MCTLLEKPVFYPSQYASLNNTSICIKRADTTLLIGAMQSTRPILIGTSGSQRTSPMTSSLDGPTNVAHSLPADMHHIHLSRFMTSTDGARSGGVQPPRAPLVGSMPEPEFRQLQTMPDLALGPPAEVFEEHTPPARMPAVLQFASSCPENIGFFMQKSAKKSWTPTLEPYVAEQDDFDLSKSPALAAMSALRERWTRNGVNERRTQQADGSTTSRSVRPEPQPSGQNYESSSTAVSAALLERLTITFEDKETEDQEERFRTPEFCSHNSVDQRRRSERRDSCGNASDSGDTGIFEFDDQ